MAGEYVATSVDHPERTQVISYAVYPVVDREATEAFLRRIADLERTVGFLGDQMCAQTDFAVSAAGQIQRCAVALLELEQAHPVMAREIEAARRVIWPGVSRVD
jgi:hypothetical protein